jgi:hypothetical protein
MLNNRSSHPAPPRPRCGRPVPDRHRRQHPRSNPDLAVGDLRRASDAGRRDQGRRIVACLADACAGGAAIVGMDRQAVEPHVGPMSFSAALPGGAVKAANRHAHPETHRRPPGGSSAAAKSRGRSSRNRLFPRAFEVMTGTGAGGKGIAMSSKTRSERTQDKTLEESFPASDPAANSGITGSDQPDRSSDQSNIQEQPTGTPTSDRHAAETANHRENERKPSPKP